MTADVSILIPVWNGARYLARAIDSALDQTLTAREVIVVDNGSDDDTPAVIDRYRNRVRAYRNPTNIGAVPNWQKAADYATGKYLSWLPCDDFLCSNWLARSFSTLEAHPDVGMYFVGFELIDADDHALRVDRLERLGCTGLIGRDMLIDFMIAYGQPNMVAGTLVRRQLFEQLGGFDTQFRGACDYDLFLRLAGRAPVFVNPEVLIQVRFHASQGSVAIVHRDNGDPDRFFEKAGDYDFLNEDQRRRMIEGLCEYARQYYHRPLRLSGLSATELKQHREQVRARLLRWKSSDRPYAKYVRVRPRKPSAALAWVAGATTPGAWLAGKAARWLSPRDVGRPEAIRIDAASEPPP